MPWGDEGVTWEQLTAGLTPEEKVLKAYEWAAGMAHQGENYGSNWDHAMQEMLPVIREMVRVGERYYD